MSHSHPRAELQALFGKLGSRAAFSEVELLDLYNNGQGSTLTTPWVYVGGGIWRRRVYGLLHGAVVVAEEVAPPELVAVLRQKV